MDISYDPDPTRSRSSSSLNKSETEVQMPRFSLVAGGLLTRFWRSVGLSGLEMEFGGRRVIILIAVTWLPLFVLSLFEGSLFKGVTEVPFLLDAETQVRFLVALPVLVFAEAVSHLRIGARIDEFVGRKIISGEEIPKLRDTIDRAHRMRDSIWLEIGIVILVCTVGVAAWRSQMVSMEPSWLAVPDGTNLNLTRAGYWFAIVSVPIFQFFLVRWYARFLIWLWFLWKISRLKLNLIATHPDRAGGIGFLSKATYSFGFLLFTQGALLAGLIANLILHGGRHLMEFKVEAFGYLVFFVALILAPLAVFIPQLLATKRRGLGRYGLLASDYAAEFQKKWIDGEKNEDEEFLGSADIQSLADLGNSYSVIREMNIAPFGLQDVMLLVAMTALPLLPLLLFIFSIEELVDQLVKVIL